LTYKRRTKAGQGLENTTFPIRQNEKKRAKKMRDGSLHGTRGGKKNLGNVENSGRDSIVDFLA